MPNKPLTISGKQGHALGTLEKWPLDQLRVI